VLAMHVYVLLYHGGKNEGIHSIECSGQTQVLMFEAKGAASRYAKKLTATGFPRPTVERIERLECETFCRDSGFLPKFIPVGFAPITEEDRYLVIPPKRNLETKYDYKLRFCKNLLKYRPINIKKIKSLVFLFIILIASCIALSLEYKLTGLLEVQKNGDHELLSNPVSIAAFVILATTLFVSKGQGVKIQTDSISPLSITKTQCRNFYRKSLFGNVLALITDLLLAPFAFLFYIQIYSVTLALTMGILFVTLCLAGVLLLQLNYNFSDINQFANSIPMTAFQRFVFRYTFGLGTALAMSDIMYLAAIRTQILFPKGYGFVCQLLYQVKYDSKNWNLQRINGTIDTIHKDIQSDEIEFQQNKVLYDAIPKKRTTIYYSDGGVNESSSGYYNKYSRRMEFLTQKINFDREVIDAYKKAKELLSL
jgi:hypothetical protein